jgi:arsenite oxidase large subunit
VPVQRNFNLGVKSGEMWFSGLMKRGNIEITAGEYSAVAMVTPAIKKGVAFSEFLKTEQPGNTIVPQVPDPITTNARFKIASGTITKIGESPYKHSFAQMSFKRRNIV